MRDCKLSSGRMLEGRDNAWLWEDVEGKADAIVPVDCETIVAWLVCVLFAVAPRDAMYSEYSSAGTRSNEP